MPSWWAEFWLICIKYGSRYLIVKMKRTRKTAEKRVHSTVQPPLTSTFLATHLSTTSDNQLASDYPLVRGWSEMYMIWRLGFLRRGKGKWLNERIQQIILFEIRHLPIFYSPSKRTKSVYVSPCSQFILVFSSTTRTCPTGHTSKRTERTAHRHTFGILKQKLI